MSNWWVNDTKIFEINHHKTELTIRSTRDNFPVSSFDTVLKSDQIWLYTSSNWEWFTALETRFKILQFIWRHHIENLFTSETKSSHKMQLPSFSRTDRHNRTVYFAVSLRFTQNKLAGDSYTVWKLWMSSFQCHK